MDNAALAGLPRVVRVIEEIRLRGVTAVSVGLAVAAYWVLTWLVDEPIDPLITLLNLGIAAGVVAPIAAFISVRRVREGLAEVLPPPRLSVRETRAQARERRNRMAGVLLVAVIALLVFDRAAGGEGRMAGLLAGLLLALGGVDWWESRRWRRAETARESRLFVLVRPHALISPYGVTDVYEEPRSSTDALPPVPDGGGLV